MNKPKMLKLFLISIVLSSLAACGGGGGGGTGNESTTLSITELIDPNPSAGNHFGRQVAILNNGNIVVSSPFDSSVAAKNGAVHLYDATTKLLIASVYGEDADDQLGAHGVVGLSNGNFVISSGFDVVNTIVNAGSVRLVNGLTGVPIGAVLVGGSTNALVGYNSVTALPNGNYVVASGKKRFNISTVAAPIRLMSGVTGSQIGATIEGTSPSFADHLGSGGVIALANNNFVVLSHFEIPTVTGLSGTVRLINGATGTVIRLITGLDSGGIAIQDQYLGAADVIKLTNGNFVYSTASLTFLVNGDTGSHIGTYISSLNVNNSQWFALTPLANGNYAITDWQNEYGSVRTVDGTNNVQIGLDYTGENFGTFFPYNVGNGPVTALTNGNYVIGSQFNSQAYDPVALAYIYQAGAVSLVDSAVPALIGNAIYGNYTNDQLSGNGITALANGNYTIASSGDDVNSITDAGSVYLVNGATGVQIGNSLAGDNNGDRLGFGNNPTGSNNVEVGSNGVTALANNNYVVASSYDAINGVGGAGSVRLMNGTTGAQVGTTIGGEALNDMLNIAITGSSTGAFFVMSAPLWDNQSRVDSGMVRVVSQ